MSNCPGKIGLWSFFEIGFDPASPEATPRQVGFELALHWVCFGFVLGLNWLCIGFELALFFTS